MFAKMGIYEPVGMFSLAHIISIFVCFALIAVCVCLTRKMQKQTYFKMLLVFAIVFSLLEAFKIGWSIANGYKNLDSWLPLYFCSLFIYALWLSICKNNWVRQMGISFLAMAGIIAGAAFIVFPTTSFNAYPIWHFQCLYSMAYHSAFVYCGIMSFVVKVADVNFKLVCKYLIFCSVFMAIGVVINAIFGCNMMFLNNPGNIPIKLVIWIYNHSKWMFTVFIMLAYYALAFITWGISALVKRLTRGRGFTK